MFIVFLILNPIRNMILSKLTWHNNVSTSPKEPQGESAVGSRWHVFHRSWKIKRIKRKLHQRKKSRREEKHLYFLSKSHLLPNKSNQSLRTALSCFNSKTSPSSDLFITKPTLLQLHQPRNMEIMAWWVAVWASILKNKRSLSRYIDPDALSQSHYSILSENGIVLDA